MQRKKTRSKKKMRNTQKQSQNKRTGGYIGIEKKFQDYNYTELITNEITDAAAIADPTPRTSPLNGIAQGDQENERIGRVTYLKSIHIKGRILFAASFTGAVAPLSHKVRLILVLDKQANGATISAASVLSNRTGTSLDCEAHYNPENVSRFKILRDVTLDEGVNAGFYDGTQLGKTSTTKSFSLNYYFKKPLKVVHAGNVATYASIATNQIHLIALGDNNSSQLRYVSRVYFYDP
jgi:hypothetical protein